MDKDQENMKKCWYMLCVNEKRIPLTPGSSEWLELINTICTLRESNGLCHLPDWQEAVHHGIVCDRAGYLSLLRDVSIGIAVRDLEDNCDEDELALIHLVRILDETDRSLSRLSERIEDYYIALHPAELAGYERNIRLLIDTIAKNSHHPLNHLSKNMQRLHDSRVNLSQNVKLYADKAIPNMSALCGPLVAARLLAQAGSKQRLAHMPASSLQVFGAGPSLFAHLTAGSNPPKHGIIYQYKGVHHAKRRVRGRVSRVLACQLGIAARIDLYRGYRDDVFVRKAGERICRAGK
jgi:nucleolar protein 56